MPAEDIKEYCFHIYVKGSKTSRDFSQMFSSPNVFFIVSE